MVSYTQRKRFELQTINTNTDAWGGFLNTNVIDLVDECFGLVCVAMTTNGDSTLTSVNGASDEGRRSQIVLTGAPTSNVRLFVPAVQSFYLVRNKMTGSFKVTLTNTGGTNGVDFSGSGSGAEQGTVISDGTNIREIFRTVSNSFFSGFAPKVIVPFFNSVGAIPSRWVLCDGTNGTPNLNDRFILGTTSNSNVDTSGGGLSLSLVSSGDHVHTVTSTVLTSANIPAHAHYMFIPELLGDSSKTVLLNSGKTKTVTSVHTGFNGDYFIAGITTNAGASLGITTWAYTTNPDAHSHTGGTSSGLHTHTLNVTEDRPPYHRMIYIMFTG